MVEEGEELQMVKEGVVAVAVVLLMMVEEEGEDVRADALAGEVGVEGLVMAAVGIELTVEVVLFSFQKQKLKT